jgi:hypothetical protein
MTLVIKSLIIIIIKVPTKAPSRSLIKGPTSRKHNYNPY